MHSRYMRWVQYHKEILIRGQFIILSFPMHHGFLSWILDLHRLDRTRNIDYLSSVMDISDSGNIYPQKYLNSKFPNSHSINKNV